MYINKNIYFFRSKRNRTISIHTPGAGRGKLFAFKAAVAPLELVQIGIRKYNVDDLPVSCNRQLGKYSYGCLLK